MMNENSNEVLSMLSKCYLFEGITDEDLEYIASFLVMRTFDKDELLYKAGSRADAIFILLSGRITLTNMNNKKGIDRVLILSGDPFGETSLFPRRHHAENAVCDLRSDIAILPRKVLPELLKEVPALRNNLLYLQSSIRLEQKKRPDWIGQGEKVIAFTQKSGSLLAAKLVLPSILILTAAAGVVFGYTSELLWEMALAVVLGLVVLGWMLWQYLDWQNDYYIITNQRVIWVEKVILLYDSRTEATFDNILSVETEQNLVGRIFNFGKVVVKTYTGQIKLDYVDQPSLFAAIIEQLAQRSKLVSTVVDKDKIQQKLQQKLGTGANRPAVVSTPNASMKGEAKAASFQGLFKMRSEDGSTITYHKHVFGLFRDVYLYVLGIFGIVGAIMFWNSVQYQVPLWFYILLILTSILLFFEVIYRYWDWRNDIYQVTADQIIDIHKKPLGQDDRKSAPLENILSTEYQRNGIFGLLFNFGTVYIKIGNDQYRFDDVADPPSVQQDIIQRQLGLKKRKVEKNAEAENEKFSEWLKVYHQQNQQNGEDI